MLQVYLDRMLTNSKLKLDYSNWRRTVLGALMVGSKVWDDQAIWNVDFCSILPELRVNDLCVVDCMMSAPWQTLISHRNALERYFLVAMRFNVSVRASEYVLFDCRSSASTLVTA